jgi:hypothetical protein
MYPAERCLVETEYGFPIDLTLVAAHPTLPELWPHLREPIGMVRVLLGMGIPDDRPVYRFALGSFEAARHLLPDPRSHEALATLAAYCDGRADEEDVRNAYLRAHTAANALELKERLAQGYRPRGYFSGHDLMDPEFRKRQPYEQSVSVVASFAAAVLACMALQDRPLGVINEHRPLREAEGPDEALTLLYKALERERGDDFDATTFRGAEAERLLALVGNPFEQDPDLCIPTALRRNETTRLVVMMGGRPVVDGDRTSWYGFGVQFADGTEWPVRYRRQAQANLMAFKHTRTLAGPKAKKFTAWTPVSQAAGKRGGQP